MANFDILVGLCYCSGVLVLVDPKQVDWKVACRDEIEIAAAAVAADVADVGVDALSLWRWRWWRQSRPLRNRRAAPSR